MQNEHRRKLSALARYAWFVLAFNVVVILWGVFLRASKSGDGCGRHWLTCNGEVIPSAPELKTVIEFSHRITTTIAGLLVIGLVVWVFRAFAKGSPARRSVIGSLVFIVTEGAVGAGLVLTGNTAETLTPTRPFWMAGHLINTFILLTFLTLTARYASGLPPLRIAANRRFLPAIALGVVVILFVGLTGSIAALSHMIFPSATLAEGVAQDFSSTSNVLLRLRLLHPISAVLGSVILIFVSGWLVKESGRDEKVNRWSNILSLAVLAQIAFGSATLLMLAPIVMQVGHLLLADAIWISYTMIAANVLSRPVDQMPGFHQDESDSATS